MGLLGSLFSTVAMAQVTTIANSTAGPILDFVCTDRTFAMASTGPGIVDVTLETDIDHAMRGDLALTLTSPLGTSVDITSGNGGAANNLYVQFDDSAATSIVVDTVTHTATVSRAPEVALHAFDGEDPFGTWTLEVCDAVVGAVGTFNQAVLTITAGIPDTDGDGVPDPLDVDDDNDGILDSEEGNADADLDGLDSTLDIDSDNDGIPDNVEAQTTSGYIAPSGLDGDNDGLDDAYETAGLTPVDSDGDGVPDYIDGDSDGDGILDYGENGITVGVPDLGDRDGDGLLNQYEGADANDGFDVNDEVDVPSIDLPDADSDCCTIPLQDDVDYRDLNVASADVLCKGGHGTQNTSSTTSSGRGRSDRLGDHLHQQQRFRFEQCGDPKTSCRAITP